MIFNDFCHFNQRFDLPVIWAWLDNNLKKYFSESNHFGYTILLGLKLSQVCIYMYGYCTSIIMHIQNFMTYFYKNSYHMLLFDISSGFLKIPNNVILRDF